MNAYYASPTGNNANDGLSWPTAKADVASAIAAGMTAARAWEGVTVYVDDLTPSCPTSGSGLRLRGPYDTGQGGPDWVTVGKPLRLIGAANSVETYSFGCACLMPGGPAQQPGHSPPFTTPALELAGVQQVEIERLGLGASWCCGGPPGVPVCKIGGSSPGGSASFTNFLRFKGCTFQAGFTGAACVNIITGFWMWFEDHCSFITAVDQTGKPLLTGAPDSNAAILCQPDPTSNIGVYLLKITDAVFQGGGVRQYGGGSPGVSGGDNGCRISDMEHEYRTQPAYECIAAANGNNFNVILERIMPADVMVACPPYVFGAGCAVASTVSNVA